MTRRDKDMEYMKKQIMDAYGDPTDAQNNANLEIIIDCYFKDGGNVNVVQNFDEFVAYASDEKNLDKFIAAGAKVL